MSKLRANGEFVVWYVFYGYLEAAAGKILPAAGKN
jgi:hypothetical protein